MSVESENNEFDDLVGKDAAKRVAVAGKDLEIIVKKIIELGKKDAKKKGKDLRRRLRRDGRTQKRVE